MSKRLVQYVKSGVASIHQSIVRVQLPFTLALLSTSCLIGPPDQLDPLEQVPPRVITYLTVPTTLAYVTSTSTEDLEFRVEFVSEDLGDKVITHLYLNLDTDGVSLLDTGSAPAGSLNDESPRPATLKWFKSKSAQEAAGCYAITMTLGYRDDYDDDVLQQPVNRKNIAYVTWWVAHNIAPQDLTFDKCPPPGPDIPQ